jgi:hypothetical protein
MRFTGWWQNRRRAGPGTVFELRPEAKLPWHGASEDVCDSFRSINSGHENIRLTIKDVEACDEVAPHTVRYRFKSGGIRDALRPCHFLQGVLCPA